jgi:eukaryotic-like serine/threonine-protein kinase
MRLGDYELSKLIGRGGMGEVWEARRTGQGPDAPRVILKRVLPEWSNNPELIQAFLDEAKITALLDSPHVARVLDFGQANGECFFVSEYIWGRSLDALLQAVATRGPATLPGPLSCLIVADILRGLEHAHTRTGPDGLPLGLVHRDISPDNVMVGFDGSVKVIDFGVAKARLKGRKETEKGLVKGKWFYFSPEQASAQKVDARSDIFAVGVVLYRLLCGTLPFTGDVAVVMRKISQGDYPSPQALKPDLSPALVEILQRALQKNPEQRYQSAARMEDALRNWLVTYAPEASNKRLRGLMHWAFADALTAEGAELKLSLSEAVRLEGWARGTESSGAIAAEPDEPPPTVSPARTEPVMVVGRPWWSHPVFRISAVFFVLGVGLAIAVAAARPSPNRSHAAWVAERQRLERALQTLAAEAPHEADRFRAEVRGLSEKLATPEPSEAPVVLFDARQLGARLERARVDAEARKLAASRALSDAGAATVATEPSLPFEN